MESPAIFLNSLLIFDEITAISLKLFFILFSFESFFFIFILKLSISSNSLLLSFLSLIDFLFVITLLLYALLMSRLSIEFLFSLVLTDCKLSFFILLFILNKLLLLIAPLFLFISGFLDMTFFLFESEDEFAFSFVLLYYLILEF